MSTEVANLQGTRVHALTPAGAAFVKKVTHPPSEIPADYQGTPDCSAPNVVQIEVKGEINIPPALTIPAGPTGNAVTNLNPSSILFMQSNGVYVGNYVFFLVNNQWIQPQNSVAPLAPIVQLAVPACLNSGYNFENFAQDFSQFRTVYKSSTYYLNATGFNNQGTVTTAKFTSTVYGANLPANVSDILRLHKHDDKSTASPLDAVNKAMNLTAIKSAKQQKIEEDGYEVLNERKERIAYRSINEIPNEVYLQVVEFQGGAITPIPNSNMANVNNVMPETASDVLTMSSKGITRPAKDGAFVVLQQQGPVSQWTTVNQSLPAYPTVPIRLLWTLMRTQAANGTYAYVPLYSTSISGQTVTPYACDVPWNNLDWSYTLFEGLTVPPQNTPSTTLTGTAYITVKTYVGMEGRVNSYSSLRPFQRLLPMPDQDALTMVTGIMHARPDSLPASANDLGTIAATAIKYLPTAVGWLKDLFGGKKEQESAMSSAKDFVRPKTQTEQATGVSKEIKELRKQLKSMNMKNKDAGTTLPSFKNDGNIPEAYNRPKTHLKTRAKGAYSKYIPKGQRKAGTTAGGKKKRLRKKK